MRIVVIGYTGPGDEAFLVALSFLDKTGWNDVVQAMIDQDPDVGFYDMSTRPEAGDGLEAIGPEIEVVVALHLNGMKGQDPDPTPGLAYNACNAMLLPLCKELHVPLLVVGDQPGPTDELVAMYVDEGICLVSFELADGTRREIVSTDLFG